jgi:Fur family ferric uptake transcriptional regulator
VIRNGCLTPSAALGEIDRRRVNAEDAEAGSFGRGGRPEGTYMAARGTPAEPQNLEPIRTKLREAGLRSTPARMAVYRELSAASRPMTHAEVTDKLAGWGFDKATVFRNLTDLVEADLVSRTELGDHVWRFEIRDPNHPGGDQHPHFVCIECGSVQCLGDIDILAASRKRSKEIGRITEILIKGHCATCDAARA